MNDERRPRIGPTFFTLVMAGIALQACSPGGESQTSQAQGNAGGGGMGTPGSTAASAPASPAGPAEFSMAAVPIQRGGQDITGGYDIDPDWPQDIAALPGHEGWTFGAGQGVFAESPDRVFVLQRGELPNLETPETRMLPEIGPSISFPIGRLPWRDATRASLPADLEGPTRPQQSIRGELGVDVRWEHCILIFDSEGRLVDSWTQYDEMLRRPHAIYIDPYDPEKHVWIVDDYRHAIFKFTNDGSEHVQTLGTPNEHGADESHFYRPTFMAFTPDAMYVSDGYANTRVVKFDKDGNYLMEWGQEGNAPNETRPGYFNNVHGVAVDHETGRVFVNDRDNRRAQVFDENGNYLDEWSFGEEPVNIHMFIITADRYLWAADRTTNKILKYNLDGDFLYSFGTFGDFPGGLWGVHGMSVDQEGNLYVAEVDNGGAQKFVPRPGARPETLIGKPVYSAWQ